ncbi:hypothetical protein PMAYCL1PPCAC_26215, partial [Pristionchus mayeri]
AARTKRDANITVMDEFDKKWSLSDAIADIRKRKGYEAGFSESDTRRHPSGRCKQTDDCLNDTELAIFRKVYHSRTKREQIRRRKCVSCGGESSVLVRMKRSFGDPDTNASAYNCLAFPQCRTRVKRFLDECNICTPHAERKRRKKRDFGQPQCYPCRQG